MLAIRATEKVGVVVEAAAGEIIEQGVEASAVPPPLRILTVYVVGRRAARLVVAADAGAVVRAGGVVVPEAGVGVQLVAGIRVRGWNVRRVVGRVGRADRQDLEDRVREVDERLELVVALGRRAAVELDRVGVADQRFMAPPAGIEMPLSLTLVTFAALRDQVLDVQFARDRGGGGARTVGRGDVVAAGRVVSRGDPLTSTSK